MLTLSSKVRGFAVQAWKWLDDITEVVTVSKVCPVNARRSAVDFGFCPVKTSIGDIFPSVAHSVVLRLYCTSGTISGQRPKFQDGPDSLRIVLNILKHPRLWR